MARLSVKAKCFGCGLPVGGAARRAAAGLGSRARAADLAGPRVLVNRERRVALGLRGDDEALRAVGLNVHGAGRRAEVQASVAQVRGGQALRVVLLVRVTRLDLRDGVTRVRLG